MSERHDPTAQTVGENIRRARTRRGLTTRDLADRLTAAGWPFSHTGITRTERGERQVTVGDLMALSVALDVSPLGLLLPTDGRGPVEVTGGGTADVNDVWLWARGDIPRTPGGDRWEFQLYSLPPAFRYAPGTMPLSPEAIQLEMEGDG